jgi:plastocyanin
MNDQSSGGETSTGNNKNLIIAGIVVVLVLAGGFLIFGRDDARETVPAAETEESLDTLEAESDIVGEEPAPVGEAAQGAVKEFTVDGSNFAFSLKEIRVNEGDTVRITLTNGSTMPHDWRVDEFNAATAIVQPGQETTMEFVADQAGTFEYYCSVGQHRQLGMVGNLIVE